MKIAGRRKTATGATGYFPSRVLYLAHTRQDNSKFSHISGSSRKMGAKAKAFGLACPPVGVFGPLCGHANRAHADLSGVEQ